ncbi:hypothetical protein OHC33_000882 [Knufia fluminis]|uniref:AB hydrolase-1 domain-containing protein n=1 Tax=Knufia fluminis TaxID=191047 RepID=A0AAN8EKY5_9EURO|nr:hypothetical protein OHC33_000882 [Knufia fluminis]
MSPNSLLHAQIIGEGTPVLFVHGWLLNGATEALDFEPIFTTLTGFNFKRIYVDLPGMGQSPLGDVTDLDSMYERLRDFVQTVIGNARFLLVGSSCGAYLCRALVHDFSGQIDGVLLRVPMVKPDNAERDVDEFRVLVGDGAYMGSLSPVDASWVKDILIQTPAYTDLMRRRMDMARAAVAMCEGEMLAQIRNDTSRYCLSRPLDDERGFPAPTLILCGRHDGVVGWRDALGLVEKYLRASFVVLDRGVHAMPVDEGDVFEALVRDWLARVQEWQAARVRASTTAIDRMKHDFMKRCLAHLHARAARAPSWLHPNGFLHWDGLKQRPSSHATERQSMHRRRSRAWNLVGTSQMLERDHFECLL